MSESSFRGSPRHDRKREGGLDGIFGLRMDEEVPCLAERASAEAPKVRFHHLPEPDVERRWLDLGSAAVERFARRASDGPEAISVSEHPSGSYRIWAHRLGTHVVAPDGRTVWSGFPEGERVWGEARLVASQLLPLLALLHGREVIHAGGVVLGDRLVAVTAPSGTGKSSTVAALVAAGGAFFADDVVAVELRGPEVRAHAGPRLFALPAAQEARMPSEALRLGRRVGTHQGKSLYRPPISPAARRLDAIVVLERATSRLGTLEPAPARGTSLLASASLPWLRSSARLMRQLDVASALDREVDVLRCTIGTAEPPPAVARRLRESLARRFSSAARPT